MARPQKTGLDYFPLDVDIDQDDKIQLIEARFGVVGFGIVIKLLMKIYKEGYFYEWTEKEQLLFSKKVNVDINEVNDIINECIKWGLFDQKLYENYRILTSKGIQRRYLEAVSRRKQVEMIKQYCLVDVLKYPNVVFVDINSTTNEVDINNNSVNDDINPESKVKKSKVNIYNHHNSGCGCKNIVFVDTNEVNANNNSVNDDINLPPQLHDEDLKRLATAYRENGFGLLPPAQVDTVLELAKEYSVEWVILAFQQASIQGHRNLAYVRGILKRWKENGQPDLGENTSKNKKRDSPKYKKFDFSV